MTFDTASSIVIANTIKTSHISIVASLHLARHAGGGGGARDGAGDDGACHQR